MGCFAYVANEQQERQQQEHYASAGLSNAFHSFHLELIFYSNLFHHNEQFCVDRSDFTMLLIF